jgi:hypothetical protein
LKPYREQGLLPAFPFGSDFTEVEQTLIPALQMLREVSASPLALLRLLFTGMAATGAPNEAALARLGLDRPKGASDRLYRALVSAALSSIEQRRV